MYLKIGNYTHEIGGPQLSITQRPVLSEGGVPLAQLHSWQIQGIVTGSGQSEIDAKVAALIAAYRQRGFDASLLLSDGVTPSQHALKNSQAIGGVRVVSGPSFPNGAGAEYATKRTFAVTLEAEIPIEDPQTALLNFRESLSLSGGDRRVEWTETKLGPPRAQMTRRQTIYRAVQSGQAVGYRQYPLFPGFLFPQQYAVEAPRLTYGGGKRRLSGDFTDFSLSWEVRYESDRPLAGRPHFA
ncbi:hypothetical protein LOC68_09885 [Blastopirellula sp. JC732]|uniref:Uncharacterized protein n=1 Tax=Blastopirellula sediminis TaxID=2894196 RepID=A0A9X1SFT8_9BACT|nr:hypothetical protein [Blastopirellula sediminis]MCC9608515.1 hypothetical protein [Blastopirellula sediminis]MCC9628708.1 hypothetical protein [Blastopirellula sediminis]